MKGWLLVLGAVKAPKNLFSSRKLLLSTASLLTDQDPEVQQSALKCLKVGLVLLFLSSNVESTTNAFLALWRVLCTGWALIQV